ncbi:MAG: hypothetical protein WAN35_21155 [Terracidiphilus sp.]
MKANGVGAGLRRRNRAEVERLVSEFAQSGLGRKEFSAAHGLSVHTLDAWRRRVAGSRQEMVPVEIVADCVARTGSKVEARVGAMRAAGMERSGPFRVVLADGLRIEVEPGFDAVELRRLLGALGSAPMRGSLQPAV